MKNKEYSVFPIQNSSACVYKWGWSTIRLYAGTSSSCHRVDPVPLTLDNFDKFHNTPEVIDDRHQMMNGTWPGRGCEYCKNVEQAGGTSDRLYHNNIPGLTPVDFSLENPVVTPRVLEVYLHNTCNLSCVYCLPIFSSKINDELKKYGPDVTGLEYVPMHEHRHQLYDKFINWFNANSSKLLRLNVMGGEPMLQKEFWHLLESLAQQKNSNLELSFNTNLNCDTATLQKFIDIAYKLLSEKRLKAVKIGCSLDCAGAPAEFVRFGLDIKLWQKNFETLIQHKWLQITVHQVLSSLTIQTAIDLQLQIAEYKKSNSKIMQGYHLVDSDATEIYHPEIFGPDMFASDLFKLVDTFPVTQPWDLEAKTRLQGIEALLKSSVVNPLRLHKLKRSLKMLDDRRGTDWKSVFPRINNFFIENNI